MVVGITESTKRSDKLGGLIAALRVLAFGVGQRVAYCFVRGGFRICHAQVRC